MLRDDHARPYVPRADVARAEVADTDCPKCGAEMEEIECGAEGPPCNKMQLCPQCYLVTWSDEFGIHLRQGVPMKDGVPVAKSGAPANGSTWIAGEPQDC